MQRYYILFWHGKFVASSGFFSLQVVDVVWDKNSSVRRVRRVYRFCCNGIPSRRRGYTDTPQTVEWRRQSKPATPRRAITDYDYRYFALSLIHHAAEVERLQVTITDNLLSHFFVWLRSCLNFIYSLVEKTFWVDLYSWFAANSGLFARTERAKMPKRTSNKQKSISLNLLAVKSKQLLKKIGFYINTVYVVYSIYREEFFLINIFLHFVCAQTNCNRNL